jgi:hypothetical protein
MGTPAQATARRCPPWCVVRHGEYAGEEDLVHLSEASFVHHTTVRLCATIDHATGLQDGPYVLLGDDEYTLDEAVALLDVVTSLLEQTPAPIPRGGS